MSGRSIGRTPSDDMATYMHFGPFLQTLATREPELTLRHLNQVGGALARFMPWFLSGLLSGSQAAATRDQIDRWLAQGERLDDVPRVLLVQKDLPLSLYRAVLDSAIAHEHAGAIEMVTRATLQHFSAGSPDAVERIALFLDALAQHVARTDGDWTKLWWFSWLNAEILQALDEGQSQRVIDWLAPLRALSTEADHILAALSKAKPERALALLDQRVRHAMTGAPAGFTALPYDLHQTLERLQGIPDQVLIAARGWFDANDNALEYSTKRLLEGVFESFPPRLIEALAGLIGSGDRTDTLFALEVLSVFEGQSEVLDLARTAAAAWGQDEEVIDAVHHVLAQEGAAMGFHGRVHALEARREQLQAWLTDDSESVRRIAKQQIQWLEARIAEESQRTRAMMARRRLAYDEDPMGPAPDAPPDPDATPPRTDDGPAGLGDDGESRT